MANIQVGNSPITAFQQRCAISEWEFHVIYEDATFGPHILLKKGIQILHIELFDEEVLFLKAWAETYINNHPEWGLTSSCGEKNDADK